MSGLTEEARSRAEAARMPPYDRTLMRQLAVRVDELEAERNEAAALSHHFRNERNRLRDGIREHRDHDFPEGSFTPAERFAQAVQASERLWSLLDVSHDQEGDA